MSGTPIGMGATLIGGAIKAFGDYRSAQAQAAADTAEAQAATQMGVALRQAADVTEYSGFRNVERVGGQYRAELGKYNVETAAGGTLVSPGVQRSISSLGVQEERETLATAQDAAQQQRIRSAQQFYKAGQEAVAAGQARTAGTYAVLGDVATAFGSTAGQATSVDPKWYGGGTDTGSGASLRQLPDPNNPGQFIMGY